MWPNFFVVGAPKAGTTSLYEYLRQIPEVYLSPIKEPHFFTVYYPSKFDKKPVHEKEKYLDLFKNVKKEKAIGEFSVTYLADPEVPKKIKKEIPDAKIIVIIRNPIERAFSNYLGLLNRGLEQQGFIERIKEEQKLIEKNIHGEPYVLGPGFYHKHIKRYYDFFGSKQVKVLIFEEMSKDPLPIVEKILEFLEITTNVKQINFKIHNAYSPPKNKLAKIILSSNLVKSTAVKVVPQSLRRNIRESILTNQIEKPKMTNKEKDILKNIYWDDVKELQKMLGMKLPWNEFQKTKLDN